MRISLLFLLNTPAAAFLSWRSACSGLPDIGPMGLCRAASALRSELPSGIPEHPVLLATLRFLANTGRYNLLDCPPLDSNGSTPSHFTTCISDKIDKTTNHLAQEVGTSSKNSRVGKHEQVANNPVAC